MDVDVTPPLEPRDHEALVAALEQEDLSPGRDETYRQAWRLASLREAALGDEAEVGYVFSPRSTRGATRA